MVFSLSDLVAGYIASNVQIFIPQLQHPDIPPFLTEALFDVLKRRRMVTCETSCFYFTIERMFLDFTRCTYLQDDVLKQVARRCSNLRGLSLTDCRRISDAGIRAIVKGCPQLRFLNLAGCRSLSDTALRKIAKYSRNLTSLDCSECIHVTDKGVSHLSRTDTLRELRLDGCRLITDTSLQHLSSGCAAVEGLHLAGLKRIDDRGVKQLGGCSKLARISLSWSEIITDESLQFISSEFHRLRQLDVKGCVKLTSVSLAAVAHGCPLLREIDVSFCRLVTDEAIVCLCMGCNLIQSIKLAGIQQLTDCAVNAVASLGLNLETIDFSGMSRVTSHAIVELAKAASNVTSIDLSYTGIENEAIAALVNMPSLNTLAVSGCPLVNDDSLCAVARQCRSLSSIQMVQCGGVSDATLLALAGSCPNLRHIDMAQCVAVTSYGLECLAESCNKLESVSLSYLPRIRDGAVWKLVGCPRLDSLDMTWSTEVSEDTVSRVQHRWPNIEVTYSHSVPLPGE